MTAPIEQTIKVGSDEKGRASTGGIVYFAKRLDTGLIKIGTTEQVKLRLNLLILEIKTEVVYLGVLPGGRKEEAEIHSKFSEFSLGHEWFSPAPGLLDFISRETMQLEFIRPSRLRLCQGKTRIGSPCSRSPKADSNFCYHHIG